MNVVGDWLKWASAIFLFAFGVGANAHYQEVAWALRASVGLLLLTGSVTLILLTAQGRGFHVFVKAAFAELARVAWPTRKETVQMTVMVMVFVLLVVVLLWGVDAFLIWAMRWVTSV